MSEEQTTQQEPEVKKVNNVTVTQSYKDIKEEERVLVIPKVFFSESIVNKLGTLPLVVRAINSPIATLLPRSRAEGDTGLVQPIPYCYLVNPNGEFLTYRRSSKGGEKRLENQYSIGFGGHINAVDVFNAFMKAVRKKDGTVDMNVDLLQQGPIPQCWSRELFEELKLTQFAADIAIGDVIYDDSTEVSSCHIGIPYMILLHEEIDITKHEDTIEDVAWVPFEQLLTEEWSARLESWSNIVLDRIRASEEADAKAAAEAEDEAVTEATNDAEAEAEDEEEPANTTAG